ncbi:type II toxin-antitoxin system death-on-curing family toxin [Enterococcus timonensis]|uniref:type II toxin-antitoxin system death-on-curing family toxin n=1 Tax=Enterococcus timonensis TaxID=1852364 RepID=UPI0008D8FBFC|nr:type II toxin-antitoxin system death-on-curing family toxin [Enterococcus timonensis]
MKYLTEEQLIRINVLEITRSTMQEDVGVKDSAALQMSAMQPKQIVFGRELYPTIFDKAAVLVINLIKRHPFYNGNKRTALVAMDVFLLANGKELQVDQEELLTFILEIATDNGDFDVLKNRVTTFLKNHT